MKTSTESKTAILPYIHYHSHMPGILTIERLLSDESDGPERNRITSIRLKINEVYKKISSNMHIYIYKHANIHIYSSGKV